MNRGFLFPAALSCLASQSFECRSGQLLPSRNPNQILLEWWAAEVAVQCNPDTLGLPHLGKSYSGCSHSIFTSGFSDYACFLQASNGSRRSEFGTCWIKAVEDVGMELVVWPEVRNTWFHVFLMFHDWGRVTACLPCVQVPVNSCHHQAEQRKIPIWNPGESLPTSISTWTKWTNALTMWSSFLRLNLMLISAELLPVTEAQINHIWRNTSS